MSHTPGPWEIRDSNMRTIEAPGGSICTPSGHCLKGRPDEELEANARLIAAAPDLLEACKQVLDAQVANDQSQWEHLLDEALERIEAAVAKAEGAGP